MSYERPRNDYVSSTMATKLLTIEPSALLQDAAHRMADRRVGAILVTDEQHHLIAPSKAPSSSG